jgi:hypothetical protein
VAVYSALLLVAALSKAEAEQIPITQIKNLDHLKQQYEHDTMVMP